MARPATVDIEEFVAVVTPDDEQRIGRLAIEMRLSFEDVLVWMAENNQRRQENAPMWRKNIDARNAFHNALNDLLDLEDERKR